VTRVLDGRRKAIEAARRERRTQRDRAADDVEDEMEKPSPPGRGLGEGLRRGLSGNAELAVGRPHPDPLPRGEGIVRGARSAGGSFLKERGASAIANLLHSTCISTPSGAMGWAGAGTAAGLA